MRPRIPLGYWKKIEGELLTETSLKESDGIEERAEKLYKSVKKGAPKVE